MAWGNIKTEAGKKNGKGAWCTNDYAKKAAKKARRRNGKKAAREDF